MRINFYANVYLVKYALPLIKRTNGRIVVISSLSGKFGLPSRSAYCASKFALTGFFESLRTEEDLPILMVYPTSLETPMRSHSLIKSEKEGGEKREDPKKCAELIIKGMDEGREDIFMPWKAKLGVLLQPIFPRFMRWKVKQAAKLWFSLIVSNDWVTSLKQSYLLCLSNMINWLYHHFSKSISCNCTREWYTKQRMKLSQSWSKSFYAWQHSKIH